MLKDRTIYRAEIPTQYMRDWMSEAGAIAALLKVEAEIGMEGQGQVRRITHSGTQSSTQVVYPVDGPIYSN